MGEHHIINCLFDRVAFDVPWRSNIDFWPSCMRHSPLAAAHNVYYNIKITSLLHRSMVLSQLNLTRTAYNYDTYSSVHKFNAHDERRNDWQATINHGHIFSRRNVCHHRR